MIFLKIIEHKKKNLIGHFHYLQWTKNALWGVWVSIGF
jgi:hypothetical protein